MYRVELWPSDKGPGGPKQGIFESPAWISSIRSDTDGGGGSKTFLPGAAVGGTTSAVLPTLAERLVAAMEPLMETPFDDAAWEAALAAPPRHSRANATNRSACVSDGHGGCEFIDCRDAGGGEA